MIEDSKCQFPAETKDLSLLYHVQTTVESTLPPRPVTTVLKESEHEVGHLHVSSSEVKSDGAVLEFPVDLRDVVLN